MKKDIMEVDRAKESYTCVNISTLEKLGKKIERLQEQLEEANEIIKGFSKLYEVYPSGNGIIIFNVVKPPSLENYIKKWGVK